MIEYLLSPALVEAIGWTLIHTLWQGALFAFLLALLLIALRSYSAQARYVVAVGLFAGFFITTICTFAELYVESERTIATATIVKTTDNQTIINKNRTSSATDDFTATEAVETSTSNVTFSSFRQRMIRYYDDNLPLIVTIWLLGVLVLLLRLLGQLAYVQRLRNYGVEQLPPEWKERLEDLEQRLHIKKRVVYALSYRVHSPLTFGWLKPIVLIPTQLFRELSDTQLKAIFAHELAHIKRDDYVVNLLQQLLLTLFFYHPGLWWMSARIEEEREHSCDDLAIQMTEQPIGYAKTLLQLTESQLRGTSLAMAYTGQSANPKGFKMRITRLLSQSLGRATYSEGFATALILCLTFGTAIGVRGYSPTKELSTVSIQNPVLTTPIDSLALPDCQEAVKDNIHRKSSAETYTPRDPDYDDFELFMQAINEGNLRLVKFFLEKGVDVNATTKDGWTPLMMAANENQADIAQLLINNGAKVNFANREGWTALTEAADEGAFQTAQVLLDAGAKVNPTESWIHPPLSVAASEGHLAIAALLIDAGAELSGNQNYPPPLHEAAEEGKLSVLKMLISKGADVNQLDDHGRTALMYAAKEGKTKIAEFLLQNGANPKLRDKSGRSAINYAAEEDAAGVIVLLMATEEGKTIAQNDVDLLIGAADEGALEVIRQLTDNGANINVHNRKGLTPLMAAVSEGEYETAQFLLDNGADVNAISPLLDWTPLLMAVREDEVAVARLLLDNGANMNVTCSYQSLNLYGDSEQTFASFYQNSTPLMVAIEEESVDCVRLLLDNNAPVNATINKRKLRIPQKYDWDDITGMDFNSMNEDNDFKNIYRVTGWTLLMEAVERENVEIINLLLDNGVDSKAKTNTGVTALDVARLTGNDEIIAILERL